MGVHRLAWLDLFRGIAALVVVAYHFHAQMHLPEIRFGLLAVDLFFVLSGIVLGKKYDAEISNGLSFREFAWVRMRRLYPMVVITAMLIVFVSAIGFPQVPWSVTTMGTVVGLLFLLPYSPTFGAHALFPVDFPVWSLLAELLANVVWFAVVKWSRPLTKGLFIVAMVAYLLLKFRVGGIYLPADESGWLNILAGQARALAWFGIGYAISMRRPVPPVPVWALLLALVGFCLSVQRNWLPAPVAEIAVILSGAALLAGLMHTSPNSATALKACTWMGMLSFPLYMTHIPASRIAVWLAAHGVRSSLAYVGTFLVVGVVATVLTEWIIRRLPPRRSFRRAVPVVPGRDPKAP